MNNILQRVLAKVEYMDMLSDRLSEDVACMEHGDATISGKIQYLQEQSITSSEKSQSQLELILIENKILKEEIISLRKLLLEKKSDDMSEMIEKLYQNSNSASNRMCQSIPSTHNNNIANRISIMTGTRSTYSDIPDECTTNDSILTNSVLCNKINYIGYDIRNIRCEYDSIKSSFIELNNMVNNSCNTIRNCLSDMKRHNTSSNVDVINNDCCKQLRTNNGKEIVHCKISQSSKDISTTMLNTSSTCDTNISSSTTRSIDTNNKITSKNNSKYDIIQEFKMRNKSNNGINKCHSHRVTCSSSELNSFAISSCDESTAATEPIRHNRRHTSSCLLNDEILNNSTSCNDNPVIDISWSFTYPMNTLIFTSEPFHFKNLTWNLTVTKHIINSICKYDIYLTQLNAVQIPNNTTTNINTSSSSNSTATSTMFKQIHDSVINDCEFQLNSIHKSIPSHIIIANVCDLRICSDKILRRFYGISKLIDDDIFKQFVHKNNISMNVRVKTT